MKWVLLVCIIFLVGFAFPPSADTLPEQFGDGGVGTGADTDAVEDAVDNIVTEDGAVTEFSLTDGSFPGNMVDEGSDGRLFLNAVTQVGDSATGDDVLALADIAAAINFAAGDANSGFTLIDVSPSDVEPSIEDVYAQNIIAIGTDCNNDIVNTILEDAGFDCGNLDGAGHIYQFTMNDSLQFIVVGNTSEETRYAARYVSESLPFSAAEGCFNVEGTSLSDITATAC